jgi:HEAT repeat protein
MDHGLPEPVLVDLMRALGPGLAAFAREAEPTLARLAQPNASFRTRFLLLGSAATLAPQSPTARAFVARAMRSDAKPETRAEAARVVTDPLLFQEELRAALSDPGVRVREAALSSLGKPAGAFAIADVVRRLGDDPWPLVRRAAAEALASVGPSADAERALLKALSDPSPQVRVGAVAALGQRGARSVSRALRDRLVDEQEALPVRTAAATALGRICAEEAADDLARYVRLLVDPTAGERQSLGSNAVAALGRLHPPDLARRLAPLLDPKAPPAARAAARAALRRPRRCRKR